MEWLAKTDTKVDRDEVRPHVSDVDEKFQDPPPLALVVGHVDTN